MDDAPGGPAERLVLLASPRGWLGPSLQAVIEPAGLRLEQVSDGETLLSRAAAAPDVIILDESLVDPWLERLEDASPPGTEGAPVLVYSASGWTGEAPRASRAWDVITEPVRSAELLDKLERLLQMKEMIREAPALPDDVAHRVDRLLDLAPLLTAIAARTASPIGCAILGPTTPATAPPHLNDQRARTLALVARQARASDLCVWIGPSELAVVLWGAGIDGAGDFIGRLARAEDREGAHRRISAGIVALGQGDPKRSRDLRADEAADVRLRVLDRLDAARDALDRARAAGGGVRVAGLA